jgi:phage tail-like protein
MVNASNLWSWLNQARTNRTQAQQAVVINLRNPVGNPVQTWKLSNAVPKKYTGPTLSGRSSNNIAIEELELSHEGLVLVPTKPSGHGHK